MPHQDPQVCAELTEMRHAIDAIGDKMDMLNMKLKAHIDCEYDMQRTIADIASAFPDGPSKHREAHEEQINAYKAQQKFWTEFWDEAKKKGLMLTMFALISIIGLGLKVKILEWLSK